MKKLIVLLLTLAVFASCQNNKKKSDKTVKKISITAAGATFPMPFYNQLISDYATKTGIQITYGGIGSGGGIRSLKDKVVDFGATDAFLTDAQAAELSAPIVHIPTCLGAVVLAYNLPGVTSLKLKNEVLAKIFMGEIKKWNDAQIKADNPGNNLPDLNISVIYRSDGSGTTFIFSDYMSKISEKWAKDIGTGKSLNWPIGMGAKGNPGVAGTIKQTEGAFGYIGSEYAFAQKLPFVSLQNKAGNFIEPSVQSISAAAKADIPADTRVMLTNSSDPDAYPISAFTWIILYKEQAYSDRSRQQAEETIKFLDWLIGADAQTIAQKVDYAPLPEKVAGLAKDILKSVTYNGEAILK
ncbi:MAG: phosphate ABC transporter substrate-binding protein PstS [Bacteroidia bacterium]|nr:phosphate ABC transporter substrate-binding protein PstS [Bacteroidia bacterium]